MRRTCTAFALLLPFLSNAPSASAATGPCFLSPADAVQHAVEGSGLTSDTGAGGFRVESSHVDRFLGGTWLTVANCDHPEWPALAIEGYGGTIALAPATLAFHPPPLHPLVRLGSRVRVVLFEEQLRLETVATAEASGSIGDRIRVRLARLSLDSGERYATAVVRGTDYLEIER